MRVRRFRSALDRGPDRGPGHKRRLRRRRGAQAARNGRPRRQDPAQPRREAPLRAGTYPLVVSDRSSIHDFHISGPGLNKVVTGVAFVGTSTIKMKLKRGIYRYGCDPRRTLMRGRFTVS